MLTNLIIRRPKFASNMPQKHINYIISEPKVEHLGKLMTFQQRMACICEGHILDQMQITAASIHKYFQTGISREFSQKEYITACKIWIIL
jgi:hypothetical protein